MNKNERGQQNDLTSSNNKLIDSNVVPRLLAATEQFRQQFVELDQVLEGIRQNFDLNIDGAFQSLQKLQDNWGGFFKEISKNNKAKSVLQEAGLLAHKTTPWSAFQHENLNAFPQLAFAHYANNWDQIERQIIDELIDHQVSDSAKQSFYDALACHRHGLYRSAVLTLLPSIEMEFRKAFDLSIGAPGASLQELRKLVGEVPAGYVLSHVAPIDMFRILDQHLYEKVNSREALEKFKSDPIPNRHAAIHGLIEYADVHHSLNVIFIADYVFLMISQLTKYSKELETT